MAMGWIQAFTMQFVFLIVIILFHKICHYFDKDHTLSFTPDYKLYLLWAFLWLGLGTWLRWYTQMPLIGMWSWIF